MEEKPIIQLGNYHLLRHLARGGMSEIYLAREEGSEQLYALKLVKPEWVGDFQHFQRETSILRALKHEHILPLHDFCVEENGIAYYVTPYIQQGSLKERLSHGPLSLAEAGDIVEQVGNTLQFIHELGLVHRDIKPANILLGEKNYVWLADFGLAKEVNTPSDLTDSSCLLGTPYYIAPELLEKQANSSSDIYALGVVLYEMLTGALPFTGQTPLSICWKHAYELPPLPSEFNPSIPAPVEQVILRALEKKPKDRFASARAMVEAYQEALLAPAMVIQPQALPLQPSVSVLLAQTLTRIKPHWSQMATLSQQRQRRPFAIAMILLAMLFFASVTTFAIEYQIQPSTAIKANAQMLSLPNAHPTARPTTATPTATPKPRVSPTARANPAPTTGNTANPANNEPPKKNHKHGKHHKDD